MKLGLKNFKCWQDLELNLDKQFILIQGKSGVGKSTIFEAIMFCLYNLNGTKFKGKVVIETRELYVERMKHPNRLIVKFEGETWQDLVAQKILDQKFKTKYISQSGLDDFLSGSSLDKKVCLEQLVGFAQYEKQELELNRIKTELEIKVSSQKKLIDFLKNKLNQLPCGQLCDFDDFDTRLEKLYLVRSNLVKKIQVEKLASIVPEFERVVGKINFLKSKFGNCLKEKQELEKQKHIFEEYNSQVERKQNILDKYSHFGKYEYTCPKCNSCLVVEKNILKTSEQNIVGKRKRTWQESEMFDEADEFFKRPKPNFDSKRYNFLIKLQSVLQLKSHFDSIIECDECEIDAILQDYARLSQQYSRFLILDESCPKDEIDQNVEKEIEKLCKLKKEHENFLTFDSCQKDLMVENEKYLELEQELSHCIVCIKKFNNTKLTFLEQGLERVKSSVDNFLEQLFCEPISIEWKQVRNGLDVVFNYKNNAYSFNDLSGGEKSRCSIAFACAFSTIENFDLMLLDESLSGLDVENQTKIVEFLKQWSNDSNIKTCIISHSIVEGFFDQVISL